MLVLSLVKFATKFTKLLNKNINICYELTKAVPVVQILRL